MYAPRYFAVRYFAPRYFAPGSIGAAVLGLFARMGLVAPGSQVAIAGVGAARVTAAGDPRAALMGLMTSAPSSQVVTDPDEPGITDGQDAPTITSARSIP